MGRARREGGCENVKFYLGTNRISMVERLGAGGAAEFDDVADGRDGTDEAAIKWAAHGI